MAATEARRSIWWLVLSVFTMAAGLFAVAAPMAAGLATTLLLGWLILFSSATHLWLSFEPQRLGSRVWHALAALAYGVGGVYLVARPDIGLLSLTLLLSVMLVAGGIFRLIAFFRLGGRAHGGAWLLVDGLLTISLGILIYWGWPETSHWAVGVLVGVTIFLNGIANFMFSLAARRSPTEGARSGSAGHIVLPNEWNA